MGEMILKYKGDIIFIKEFNNYINKEDFELEIKQNK
jgi:hypothetical protein